MLKLGCVPYMNALPLTYALNPQEVELIHRPPAELFKLLQNGQVEAALLPIVNYFENPDLYLVPNLAIACRGSVKSVSLYFECHREEFEGRRGDLPGALGELLRSARTIYLDPESRTSHALLKVILHHKYGINLNTLHFTSNFSHSDIDAKLLIGDKTFHEKGVGFDLGAEWYSWQNKPFVFAAWMTLDPKSQVTNLLLESRNQGLQNIDKIIDQLTCSPSPHPGSTGSPRRLPPRERGIERSLLKHYFTKNIHYTMEGPELDGIRQFYKLLKPIQGYLHELNFKFVS